ncbi:hypothetical protein WOLCODRAFT_77556 [Wolfiporia cocos MD-104 SS10]|uniref:Ricin B lectin domain-containing protein n=1 Tax=Wolfiporia cocos (strain MD-104) TaxID=742152 RepID=A0A2H3JSK9_WOLCO|nr:hypothetical protein WOLCODRAFT_77556 [Wolfiporia cocos MD-104 SS10]
MNSALRRNCNQTFNMSLDTGRYIIRNVRNGNTLLLADPNDGSSIVGTADESSKGRKVRVILPYTVSWNVVKLGNGKYTIENQTHASYASCGTRATSGADVVGRVNKQQFDINVQLCWGLTDGQEGTPVALSESYTDSRNHWQFIRVRD